ncbi:MAG: mechanosensitive ion channel [Acidobacteriota bacterium]|nr:mechanosensitive ion channel [Acidobacteriota bacterium]
MQRVASHQFARLCLEIALFVVLFGLVAVAPAAAQETGAASIPTPSPTPQPTPIPASDIPSRAADAADAARQAVANAAPDARLQEIQQKLPDEQARIKTLRASTTKHLGMPGPASMIKESEKAWVRAQTRLVTWLVDLSSRSSTLDKGLDDLKNRISLWQLTREHESGAKLPEAVINQISDTLKSLAEAENEVRSARNSILDLQAAIAQEKSGVDEMIAQMEVEINKRTKGVTSIDSPPLWKAFGVDDSRGDAREQFLSIRKENWRSLKNYIAEQTGLILVWVLMWPALIVLMVFMHRKAEVWAQQDKSLQKTVKVLSRPASAAMVVTATLNALLEPQAPNVWTASVSLLLVLATVRLLSELLPKSMRLVTFFAILLFLLSRVVKLAPEGFVIYRLALLALGLGGIAACVWLIRALRANPDTLSKKWHRAVLWGGQVALVGFGIGAVADVVGSVDFATLVLMGTSQAMLVAVLMGVLSVTLRSMVRIGLLTETARRMGIAPDHSDTVRNTLFRMISFVAVVGWTVVVLRAYLLLDPLIAVIRRALDWSMKIGDFSIDPGDLLIFGFTIWLSFKVAAFIEFMLNVDFLPRVDLPKGVPETISRLTRYVVIAVGAVIASAAAGFDISKITIIIGALGVGIGFGLQNIVNNFVSGLILLFERPIRIGDTLDIGNSGGTVEKIGMRASIVSTWEGAEVVVPNADLISEKVTNWTLTHSRRRMTIPVGVAYGTDPENAAQLILGVATGHKHVDAHPAPVCLFQGFGDSALEFELRAWAATSSFVGVASDLRFAIVKTLEEADIEIPFPQRDIHLRTPDPEAVASAGLKKPADVPTEDGAVGSDGKTGEDSKKSGS